jgi:hypothetical protein
MESGSHGGPLVPALCAEHMEEVEPAQTATAIPSLLSSLSSTQGSTLAHISARGRSAGETDCEVYRELAYKQLDFQRWYETRFLPRKRRPAMLAAEKRRD